MKHAKTPLQICPICAAQQPLEALRCEYCGAALRGTPIAVQAAPEPAVRRAPIRAVPPSLANAEVGEADLYEGALQLSPLPFVLIGALIAVILIGTSLFFWLQERENARVAALLSATPTDVPPTFTPSRTPTVTQTPLLGTDVSHLITPLPIVVLPTFPPTPMSFLSPTFPPDTTESTRIAPPPTNTRLFVAPTLNIPTVTPVPPTRTPTPTLGPCIQKAAPGDTLYAMALRCGHRHAAVIEVILRRNNLSSPAQLQVGQEIEIPRPTVSGQLSADSSEADPLAAARLEPTLPPGIMWYTVKRGETALSIVLERGITMSILSNLNPEILFEGCDFGQVGGGASCRVMVYEGQRLRVPAPTPTPTIPSTPSGSETPTPTVTPTVNAPFSLSPSNNMLFDSFELPTLRWTASGQLSLGEVYLVTVINRTTNQTYNVTTRELFFTLPAEWQPSDGRRHIFAWQVTIAEMRNGNTVIPSTRQTEVRTFMWQSRR
ncbi:MAG: LysM peptidoglycan-binding domain-containing protein [Anaerolineae bacterium]|nr:LysM peptidoglycan-binding domain-containing protein [Anaerolineae bacterium]